MYTLVGLVVELVTDGVEMARIFLQDVALGVDPLSTVSWAFGVLFVTVAVLAFGYGVLGAVFKEFGVDLPALGQ